ncbi:hypothetical protein HAX54_036937 [Datura stramonium]|uniref:Uncharacterized protein n=1 Tax=Datura stramonium TaxID=4076 RepID=A0ABS8VKU4_DATST|nr:hypothetical protein [Datura stramonium]
MDIDMLKSAAAAASSEDQMEMMLMMQLDKFPEFSTVHKEVATITISIKLTKIHPISSTCLLQYHSQLSSNSSKLNFLANSGSNSGGFNSHSMNRSNMAAMREMIFRIAAMQPINIDPESVKPPKRRNVKISTDPQSVAARHRREKDK